MKKKKQSKDDELNFWQPASDMFSALLLILMLVILLLGLYLVHIPEHDQLDPWIGNNFTSHRDAEADSTASPTPTMFVWFYNPNGGDGEGGWETPHPTYTELWATASPSPSASPTPTVSPTPDLPGSGGGTGGGDGGGNGEGEGPGEQPDVGAKSAVYVMIIDAETERTIKEANVEFELYGLDNALQILNTYYPDRITYRMYETTEAGTFYFPEKLILGEYELHELSEAEGYDAAENVPFILDNVYDWPEPLVVRVPLKPSRNIIRVQMLDDTTGLPVAGGSFDIVAAENIITGDGTLRYRSGQVAGEIVCDEEGYGESEEIYLGNYYLRQKDIPRYYASMLEDVDVAVEKKSDVLPATIQISCDRTTVKAKLTDELYPTRDIASVTYRVTANRGNVTPFEVTTNMAGEFILDELEKGVTYRIRQVAPAENYRADSQDYAISISADGRIDGEPTSELLMTSRMIRIQVGITDEFSNVQVPGVNLALYSSADGLIRTWTSSGAALMLEGLEPGMYYMVKDGETENHYDVNIRDTAEVQSINLHTSYVLYYVAITAIAVIVLLGVTLTSILIIRRRRRKKAA